MAVEVKTKFQTIEEIEDRWGIQRGSYDRLNAKQYQNSLNKDVIRNRVNQLLASDVAMVERIDEEPGNILYPEEAYQRFTTFGLVNGLVLARRVCFNHPDLQDGYFVPIQDDGFSCSLPFDDLFISVTEFAKYDGPVTSTVDLYSVTHKKELYKDQSIGGIDLKIKTQDLIYGKIRQKSF